MPLVQRKIVCVSDAAELLTRSTGRVHSSEVTFEAVAAANLADAINHLGQLAKFAAEMFQGARRRATRLPARPADGASSLRCVDILDQAAQTYRRAALLGQRVEAIETKMPLVKTKCDQSLRSLNWTAERALRHRAVRVQHPVAPAN